MTSISFDIDGVLNNYPKCFLDYCAIYHKINFTDISLLKNNIGITRYKFLKDLYRKSDFKYSIPVDLEMVSIVNKLAACNKIYIISSRPFKNYPDMYYKTFNWLKNGGLNFEGLLPKTTNALNDKKISLHIDDELDHIVSLLSATPSQFILFDDKVCSIDTRIKVCTSKNILINVIQDIIY